MSAISWREQSTHRPAPTEQAVTPALRVLPWLGVLCALALSAYPNLLVWPAGILGLITCAAIIARSGSMRSGVVNAGLIFFTLALGLGFAAAGGTDPALVRLTGYGAAIIGMLSLLPLLSSVSGVNRVGAAIALGIGAGELVILALLKGSLPSSPFTRVLQPFTRLFSGFPGITGDTLEVNARFAVHQYGLAHLALAAAPFGIALALSRISLRWRILGAVWAVANVALLLATQSRGAVLALAVAAALMGSTRTRWSWAAIPAAGAVLLILILRGTLSRQIESDWLASRLSIWGRTMQFMVDFPLTGAGLGARTYAEVFAWYHGMPDIYTVSHTHNVILQAYAEQGLLGAVGLSGVLVGGSVLSIRAIRWGASPTWVISAGAGAAFIGSALYGLTDQVVSSNLSLLLVLALLAVVSRSLRPTTTSVRQTFAVNRRFVPFVGVAAINLAVVLLSLSLGTRWLSGLALNAGSLDLVHALASPGLTGDAKRASLESAEGWLARSVALNPMNIAAWRNLGWTRTARNDIPGAHVALDQAASATNLNDFERYELGRLYYQLGFTQQAIEQWRAAGDRERLVEAMQALKAKGDWRTLVTGYAALASLEPDNSEHLADLALAVVNSGGSVDEAMGWLQSATTLNPEGARALSRQLVLRGEPYRINERRGGGDADKALFWFGLASRVDQTYDRPEVEMGAVLLYRDRYVEAEQHFREALRRDDSDPSTWNWVGQVLERLGRQPEAIEMYRGAVAKRPNRGSGHAALARALITGGQTPEAITEYREAIRLDPNDQQSRDELAALEARAGS